MHRNNKECKSLQSDKSIKPKKPIILEIERSTNGCVLCHVSINDQINLDIYRKERRCKCTKTKCKKMYCDCLKRNYPCNDRCGCSQGCLNRLDKAEEKNAQDIKEEKGCKCKKSFCLKKYCECFLIGKKCSEKCHCNHCGNKLSSLIRQTFFQGFIDRNVSGKRKHVTLIANFSL